MVGTMTVACLSHRPEILQANLAASPAIRDGSLPLHVVADAASAASGHNRALDETESDIVIFAHHDVYLPLGWERLLEARIAEVAAKDPDWALIGAFGVGDDQHGYGPVWSSSLGYIVGRVPAAPVAVQSFDELLVVMRRSSGLRFDPDLPGFHLWATDIVTQARERGLGAWSCPLPLVHNDGYHDQLDDSFGAAFHHLRRKWHARLPLRSPVIGIDRLGLNLARQRWRNRKTRAIRIGLAQPTSEDPARLAARCGWADLRAVAPV